MSNEWLDEQIRTAYEQVVLPKSTLARLKKQSQRHESPSRLWLVALLVAAALAVAIIAAWPDPQAVPSPASPVPMQREPIAPEPLAPLVPVVVRGDTETVLIDGKDILRVGQRFELRQGEHSFALRDPDGTVYVASRIDIVKPSPLGFQEVRLKRHEQDNTGRGMVWRPTEWRFTAVMVMGPFAEVLVDDTERHLIRDVFELREGEHTFRGIQVDGRVGESVPIKVSPKDDGKPLVIVLPAPEALERLPEPPVSPRPVLLILTGSGSEAVIDGGKLIPLNAAIELMPGVHTFRLRGFEGELGDTVSVDIQPSDNGKPLVIQLPDPDMDMPPMPAPEPAPSVRIEGLWVGATSSGRSFKLTVLGQSGDRFEGTTEMQQQNGSFASHAIEGTVGEDGTFRFQAGSTRCEGRVAGRKMTGTCGRDAFTAYGGI